MALEVDVDSFRAKWWTVVVSILFIGIPSVMVLLFFTIPDQMFLDGTAIPNDYQSAVFHNLARSNACGDTLAIVVCFFMVTTREFSVFKVCNIALTVWMALENLMVLVELATYGQITDAVGDTVDLINLFLMLYMVWKIRSTEGEGDEEASPLL
jgi:hypothetical protein